ncbi:MAG: putative adhesin [Bacteroidota bacterium]|jgi:hypothetical protein
MARIFTSLSVLAICVIIACKAKAQSYTFDYNNNGSRVCLVTSKVNLSTPSVQLIFLDSAQNTTQPSYVYRRSLGTHTWTNVASALAPGTGTWTDNNVSLGQCWEYQVKRLNTWNFNGTNYDATGYTLGTLLKDNSNYKGQMILLVANDVISNVAVQYATLKQDFANDGWFVRELAVPRATSWDDAAQALSIKNQIVTIYNNAPANDKPKAIFILGHVPLPRSGSTAVVAPDEHDENKGARGCDGFYADIDGQYTDLATYNPGGLATNLAINLPNDKRWDQDFFPSDVEMAFGRIDFADITDVTTDEFTLLANYLDRLSNYKRVAAGSDMGNKTAFHFGYDNSNDGSYRSLLNISKPQDVMQEPGGNNHNQWVQNNGPFKFYMQNVSVPEMYDWQTYGMNAAVFSSDQSYWGFGDVPQQGSLYSRIRALLGVNSKCVVTLWTTTGINMFHQACEGQSLGIAMKDIINHNATNQYLEKPPQVYDTEDWWNRTHFAYWGDPTINLYQVMPASNLRMAEIAGQIKLQWTASADNAVLGYHVYSSDSALGAFQKISTQLITDTQFVLSNYTAGKWYAVKAIKEIESGCGKFMHPSIGIAIQATIPLQIAEKTVMKISISPNPFANAINISSTATINRVKLLALDGKLILEQNAKGTSTILDCAAITQGIYIVEVYEDGDKVVRQRVRK